MAVRSDRHALAETGPRGEAGDGVPPGAAGAAQAQAASIGRPEEDGLLAMVLSLPDLTMKPE